MSEHIGKILQEKLKEPGMPTVKDFADMLPISTRTLYNVFKNESVFSLDQVIKASEILNFDLIEEYLKAKGNKWLLRDNDSTANYVRGKKQISINLEVRGELKEMSALPEFLSEVNILANRLGLELA